MKDIHRFITGVIFILQGVLFGLYYTVEARRGDVIPLGQLYGSSEQRHIKNTELKRYVRNSFEYDKAEYPEFRKRKAKKKHKVNKNKILVPNSVADERYKRRKNRRSNRRFFKTTFKDTDKDSKFSESEENNNKAKPVDIIVHIKMKD